MSTTRKVHTLSVWMDLDPNTLELDGLGDADLEIHLPRCQTMHPLTPDHFGAYTECFSVPFCLIQCKCIHCYRYQVHCQQLFGSLRAFNKAQMG